MAGLGCCLWWFLAGGLLGWLASWLLGRTLGRSEADFAKAVPAVTTHAGHSGGAVRASTTTAGSSQSVAVSAFATHTAGIDLSAARAAGFMISGVDNFEAIEGVGPAIAQLLRSNGVSGFGALAGMSVPALQALLDAAGPRFRTANPGTWPEQAALAAANRWADLRKLQDELIGGVRRV
jgi:predicted flap endonuclease-1-like 5' DNA nuclease